LRLMPVDARQPLLDDWYQNSGKLKMWMDYQAFDDDTPSALGLPEKQPKKAFAEGNRAMLYFAAKQVD
ncbi:fatty acid cis/trans isomerase, partial [Bacillus sp. S70]|uniref:fatty acid cis/trans isomerase n=1 Tax=Bacillus sp. S70 TaxID=1226988 RepID=UPI00190DCAF0